MTSRLADNAFRFLSQDHLSFGVCHADDNCHSLTHLSCLSKRFLSQEASSSTTPPPLLPDRGTCPSCAHDIRWGDVIRGCYRRKAHADDGGAGRRLRMKRAAKKTKEPALAKNGENVGDDQEEGEDVIPKKPPVKRGRKPKIALEKSGSADEAEKPKRGRKPGTKATISKSSTQASAAGKKISVLSSAASAAEAIVSKKAKKKELVYEDLSDSSGSSKLSELSERFDFDSDDDEAAPVDEDEDEQEEDHSADDQDRRTAFFAAAEGSLEMQMDDLDLAPSDSDGNTESSSPINTSPKKKRRTATVVELHKSAPQVILEISD
jgi:hypothetical protein